MAAPLDFSVSSYVDAGWQEHENLLAPTLASVREPLAALVAVSVQAVQNGRKIFFFGNGGSAADAQHLATELTVRFSQNRKPIPALALTTDTSALTAIGNDYDFTHLFSRQLEALCQTGDIVVGISTSGNSENVIKALRVANDRGAVSAAFTGGTGGKLPPIVQHLLCVPSTTTARIQEMHILIGQLYCGALEKALGYV
jgi:D-sedoheptulose 7-phosphate isomerase